MLFGFYPFVRYEEKEFQNKSNQLIANLSKKVAHDIRTPISTLNLISSKIADQDIKKLQQAVVNQINLIAEDLLNTSNQKVVSSLTRQTYLEFFEQIQQEYDLKQNFRTILVFNIDKEVSKYIIIYAKVLYPIICNVINNSIEACHIDNGEIEISARLLGNQFYIKIRDNGKGIPSEILSLLGRKQISYGKSNSSRSGNGIALFNARKDIESINGRFEIRSTLNEFTEVEIYIPLT